MSFSIRSNASTARSNDAPTWSASSPMKMPSCVSSVRSCSNRTMNGRFSAAANDAPLSDDLIIKPTAVVAALQLQRVIISIYYRRLKKLELIILIIFQIK
jgi:hypothetical protein